jgi:hypothetical protein
MDEIFSLHEHRHLITFNGHRFLLVFLVNLWNLERGRERERERVNLFPKDDLSAALVVPESSRFIS